MAGTYSLFSLGSASGATYPMALRIAAGKLAWYMSSAYSSFDIISNPTPTGSGAALTANTAYDIEMDYDPVAGKYFCYVNGVADAGMTTTSSLRMASAPNGAVVGAEVVTGGTTPQSWFNGSIQAVEVKPYCAHPAGTSFTPQTALASISASGYASDWFDAANMVMKSPSAASTVAGNNPTFSTVNKLYLGEATAGASAITSVVSYAFQGQYVALWTNTLPGGATAVSLSDNLGTILKDVRLETLCLTAELGFSVGDIIEPFTYNTVYVPFVPRKQRNTSSYTTGSGSSPWQTNNATSGALSNMTSANWAYRARAKRSF